MTVEEIRETREVLQKQIDLYGQEYDAEGIEALNKAIKMLKTQERLTEMLYKQITAYAEMEKTKNLHDLEYGRKTAYAHCLEVLNDD
jgi:hypothetical protein